MTSCNLQQSKQEKVNQSQRRRDQARDRGQGQGRIFLSSRISSLTPVGL